jgi:hypothetical protein
MESWKEFTIEEIFTAIEDEFGHASLGVFLVEMIEMWHLPIDSDLSDLENSFSPSRLMEEIENHFMPEDLIVIENRLNGICPVPYHRWIDVRNPEEFERVKRGLNKYEMIAYVSKTRSKWSMALWNNGKLVEYGGVTKGNEIRPKFIMRIDVENFNMYNDSAEVIYNKKSK